MIVFSDFHHAGLLNSLIMLFEGRLKGELYRPIGMEWAEQGFWKIYDHPATQAQFLGIGGATPDGTPKLNEVELEVSNDEYTTYFCKDIEGDKTNKAITLEGFLNMPVNIVIASIPQHIEPFKHLCNIHPNHPNLIFQIGNAWTVEAGLAPNIMASSIINDVPLSINFISYHQEFDLNIFKPHLEDMPDKHIYSFVNCFDILDHFKSDWHTFTLMEQLMGGWYTGWDFKAYGGQCRDGSKNGTQEVANAMREARFIWHTKAGGDGYGHVLHSAAAMGKPMIVSKNQYYGKMGDALLIDGVTCINIDGLLPTQIMEKIEFYSEPDRYKAMSEATYENFKKVVDFDKEFEEIKIFLANLK